MQHLLVAIPDYGHNVCLVGAPEQRCLVWHAVLPPMSPQHSKQHAGMTCLQGQKQLLESQLASAQQATVQLTAKCDEMAQSKASQQAELDAMHAEMRSHAGKLQSAEVSPACEFANHAIIGGRDHDAFGCVSCLSCCCMHNSSKSVTAAFLDLFQQI